MEENNLTAAFAQWKDLEPGRTMSSLARDMEVSRAFMNMVVRGQLPWPKKRIDDLPTTLQVAAMQDYVDTLEDEAAMWKQQIASMPGTGRVRVRRRA